jgi:hypothetical protein
MSKRFDVLGLGCAAVDDILYVEQYPPADAKVHVLRRERHCGGLTATAIVAAARLGAKAAFAGTLGFDEGSEFVFETFRSEGVDVRHAVRSKAAAPVRSVIIVDEKRRTRNVFAYLEECVALILLCQRATLSKRAVCCSSTILVFLEIFARLASRGGQASRWFLILKGRTCHGSANCWPSSIIQFSRRAQQHSSAGKSIRAGQQPGFGTRVAQQ